MNYHYAIFHAFIRKLTIDVYSFIHSLFSPVGDHKYIQINKYIKHNTCIAEFVNHTWK